MGDGVDGELLVTNLVYFGTLLIGGVLLLVIVVSLVGAAIVAGVAQLAISVVKLSGRIGAHIFVYHPEEAVAQVGPSEHVRNAVVAKADAILAAARSGAEEAAATAKSNEAATAAARRQREAAEREAEKAPAARANSVAERAPLKLAYSDRIGPFTGTQPLVKAG